MFWLTPSSVVADTLLNAFKIAINIIIKKSQQSQAAHLACDNHISYFEFYVIFVAAHLYIKFFLFIFAISIRCDRSYFCMEPFGLIELNEMEKIKTRFIIIYFYWKRKEIYTNFFSVSHGAECWHYGDKQYQIYSVLMFWANRLLKDWIIAFALSIPGFHRKSVLVHPKKRVYAKNCILYFIFLIYDRADRKLDLCSFDFFQRKTESRIYCLYTESVQQTNFLIDFFSMLSSKSNPSIYTLCAVKVGRRDKFMNLSKRNNMKKQA